MINPAPSTYTPLGANPPRPKGLSFSIPRPVRPRNGKSNIRHAKNALGILKNSSQHSPPVSPAREHPEMTEKELTIHNTKFNAGSRRLSSASARPGSCKTGSRTPSLTGAPSDEDSQQRLKWDEANLYLTEQERTSTMKINEPKTPYAKHYDPSEDPSDGDEDHDQDQNRDQGQDNATSVGAPFKKAADEIPGLSLGEPEEPIPEPTTPDTPRGLKKRSASRVHVDDAGSGHDEEDNANLSEEERQKHKRFEDMRKKHYEMKNVAYLLGHPEAIPDDDDEEEEEVPPLPSANGGAK